MPKTQLMGILNVTPDSFYDGGKHYRRESAIKRALEMVEEGADIIDIGGESTRPGTIGKPDDKGAQPVSAEEEMERVIPVIESIRARVSVTISIDTMKVAVAQAAVEAGAGLINDVTGFRDPAMRAFAGTVDLPICVMHMQGEPRTMQKNPTYKEGIIPFLINYFEQQVKFLEEAGVKKENIILDPGIGFGKTVEDNLKILQNLRRLKAMGLPVLLGFSRKSFLCRILNTVHDELLAPTIAMNTLAIGAGVDMIRVHDVKEHRRVIDLLENIRK